jgi:hypothetical protein
MSRAFSKVSVVKLELSSLRVAQSWQRLRAPPDRYDVWLDPVVNDFQAIRDIFKPYDANLMRRYPVSRKLNNSRIDDAESASPVLDAPTQAKLF